MKLNKCKIATSTRPVIASGKMFNALNILPKAILRFCHPEFASWRMKDL
jgi:hypothetical protein